MGRVLAIVILLYSTNADGARRSVTEAGLPYSCEMVRWAVATFSKSAQRAWLAVNRPNKRQLREARACLREPMMIKVYAFVFFLLPHGFHGDYIGRFDLFGVDFISMEVCETHRRSDELVPAIKKLTDGLQEKYPGKQFYTQTTCLPERMR